MQIWFKVHHVHRLHTNKFKYNTRKYFWYLNGYLYAPNIDWEAIKVEAVFDGVTNPCNENEQCEIAQDKQLNIPEYLFSEVEQFVIKELTMTMQVPSDGADDSQNTLR